MQCEEQKDRGLFNTLQTFQTYLDVKITFGEDLIANPNQLVVVRQLFLHPHRLRTYQLFEINEIHNSYNSKMMKQSILGAAKVSLFIIATAGGNVLPPMFLVREKNYVAQWFLPLNDQVYKFGDALHPYAHSDWVKQETAVHITDSYDLDDRAVDKVFKHISYNLRNNPKGSYIDKGQGVLLILPRNFSGERVKLHDKGEQFNFEVAVLPDIRHLTIDPFDFGIAECFDQYFREHIADLDIYFQENRNTIRQKLMLGQLAHGMIQNHVVLRSFEDSGFWPIRFERDDYSFHFKFADKDTYLSRVLKTRRTR